MADPVVIGVKDGPLLVVTLNRPEKRNAVYSEVMCRLYDAWVELDRDDYRRFHDGRYLDLREDARAALLLEIPITPHCREDCRGLCPRCGADLNDGPCACDHDG